MPRSDLDGRRLTAAVIKPPIWFRYVCHHDIPAREAEGWVVCADLGRYHGCFSVLMRWTGEGSPPP
jgi:hypothetical protein